MSVCLMLHGLGPVPPHVCEEEKPYWVTEEVFAAILELGRDFPLRLTIDDGNASDFEIALPRLKRAGMRAAFFIPTDRINTPGYLSEDAIRALHAAGMEIGSHGCAHLSWTDVSSAEIAHDVTRSMERLGLLTGEPVRALAVPFGRCDRRVLRLLRSLGVGRVYTSFAGPEVENAWLVRRECIMAAMNLDAIRALVGRRPALSATVLNFLRQWRHAGRATLWTVPSGRRESRA
jgi:peptidoglycan/xylan/chitin deacetylase (PgdA/CDA1 family)